MLPQIDAPAGIVQTVTADVVKVCPVKNEIDKGTVTITYTIEGKSFELHALADYLASFATVAISHEDFTQFLAEDLSAQVRTEWTTAGMKVVCVG